jgi:aryl-alcohol dehydrogenase (NADP+)
MHHTKFGRTGLRVSRLCLGTMTFGLQCHEQESIAILDAAAEGGIDFLDTADVYPLGGDSTTTGRTEEILGRWLKGKRAGAVSLTLNFLRFWDTMVSKIGGAHAASQLQTASIPA